MAAESSSQITLVYLAELASSPAPFGGGAELLRRQVDIVAAPGPTCGASLEVRGRAGITRCYSMTLSLWSVRASGLRSSVIPSSYRCAAAWSSPEPDTRVIFGTSATRSPRAGSMRG